MGGRLDGFGARLRVVTPLVLAAFGFPTAVPAQGPPTAQDRTLVQETHRLEGEAVLALADEAMSGSVRPPDFSVAWHNDVLKAQDGTFVPFTLTIDATRLRRASVLVYVRAMRRLAAPADLRRKAPGEYPVDAIFPVELAPGPDHLAHIRRGFSVAPGEYDIVVVVRERLDPAAGSTPKVAVVRQSLTVPDFWTGELTASSVILADRMIVLAEPIPPTTLAERPYVIGQNDITPAADRVFRRREELIVVVLVYNPTVDQKRKFDLQVEYHFYRKGQSGPVAGRVGHPPAREGEQYFNRTDPQRFTPAVMGAEFDAASGQPVLAGQGVSLAGFELGDYRLGITITDLLSGQVVTRDVYFTVES